MSEIEEQQAEVLSTATSASIVPGAIRIAGSSPANETEDVEIETTQSEQQQIGLETQLFGLENPLVAEIAPTEADLTNRIVARLHTELEEQVEQSVHSRLQNQVAVEAVNVSFNDNDNDESKPSVLQKWILLLLTGTLDHIFCQQPGNFPYLIQFAADCLGDTPKVNCTCCTLCCAIDANDVESCQYQLPSWST